MKPPNVRSVRFRTTVGAATALAVLLLLAGLIINQLVANQIRDAADAVLLERAGDRARQLEQGSNPGALVTVVGEEVVAAVVSPTGEVLASSSEPSPGELAGLPEGISEAELTIPHDGSTEREVLRAAVASTVDGSMVVVASEGEQAEQAVNAVRTILAITGPIVVVVGALVAWAVTGRALAPVNTLRAELDSVIRLSESARVGEPGTGDEIEALATTTNSLLERLEVQSAARRRFVADASHELKSPIANAKAILETAEAPSQAAGQRVLGELHRLQDLVDDLLFLASTDEASPTTATSFDLDDVVFDEAERATVRTDKIIDASGVVPARAKADRNEVARAIRNLIENAVRHADHRVVAAIEPDGDRWMVVVADDGPGIPFEQRDRVFDRFTRLDSDRTRADGGTGLGLSIVASIAARNHGSVQVSSGHETTSTDGARFEFRLPRA